MRQDLKLIATLTLILLLAGVISLVWLARDTDSTQIEEAVERDSQSRSSRARRNNHQVSEEDSERRAVEVSSPSGETDEGPVAPASILGGIWIEGTAVRIQDDGHEAPLEDGYFTLRTITPSRGFDVKVIAGKWRLRIPESSHIRIIGLSLGGVAIIYPDAPLALPANNRVHLRGPGLVASALRVVDEATGQDLEGVDIAVASASGSSQKKGHPGKIPEVWLLRNARSPVQVPAPGSSFWTSRLYWVRARGYAWKAVALEHAKPATEPPTVALSRSGELMVELIGYQPATEATIELRTEDRPHHNTFAKATPDETGKFLFSSILPGEYRINVVKGVWQSTIALGEGKAVVRPGIRTRSSILVTPIEIPSKNIPFAGTLIAPAAWTVSGLKLTVAPALKTRAWADGNGVEVALKVIEPTADGMRRWSWSTTLPVSGSYDVVVDPLQIRRPFVLGAEGQTDVVITLDDPAEVFVSLVDETTENPASIDLLQWSGPKSRFTYSWGSETVTRDPNTSLFSFLAPLGDLALSIDSQEWELVEPNRKWKAASGKNYFTVPARRTTGIRLIFMDEGKVLPWSWDWQAGATMVGTEQRSIRRSIGHLWFDREGTFELRTADIKGYRNPSGLQFEVKKGCILDVTVPLERER